MSKKRSSKTPSPVPTDTSAALSDLLFSLDAPPPSSFSSHRIHRTLPTTPSPQPNRVHSVHEVIDADADEEENRENDEMSLLSLVARRGNNKKKSTLPSASPPPKHNNTNISLSSAKPTSLFIPSIGLHHHHPPAASAAIPSRSISHHHHHHVGRSVTPPIDTARSQVSKSDISALPTAVDDDCVDLKGSSSAFVLFSNSERHPQCMPSLSSPSTDASKRKNAFEEVKSMLLVAEDVSVLNSSTRSLKPYNMDDAGDDEEDDGAVADVAALYATKVAEVEEKEELDCTPVDAAYEGLRHSYIRVMCIVQKLYGHDELQPMSPPPSAGDDIRLVEDDDELSASASELGNRLNVAQYLVRLDITSLYLTHCCYRLDGTDREVPRRSFVDAIIRGTATSVSTNTQGEAVPRYHEDEQRLLQKWMGGSGARSHHTNIINPHSIPSAELQVRLCALLVQQLTVAAPPPTNTTLLQLPTVIETLDALLTLRSIINTKNNGGGCQSYAEDDDQEQREEQQQSRIKVILLPLLQELFFSQVLLLGALRNLGQVHTVFFGTRDKACRGTYPGLMGAYSQDVTKWLRFLATISIPSQLACFSAASTISDNIASLDKLFQSGQFGDQHGIDDTTTSPTRSTFVEVVRGHLERMKPIYHDVMCLQDGTDDTNKVTILLPRGVQQLFAETLTESSGHENTATGSPPAPVGSSSRSSNTLELPRKFDCGLFGWLMNDINQKSRSETLEWYICCMVALQAEYRLRHACRSYAPTTAQYITLHYEFTSPSNLLQNAYKRKLHHLNALTSKWSSRGGEGSQTIKFSSNESLKLVEFMIEVSETIRTGAPQHNNNFVSRLIASDCDDEDLGHYIRELLPKGGLDEARYMADVAAVPQHSSTSCAPVSPLDCKNYACVYVLLHRIAVFINSMASVLSRATYHPDALLTIMGRIPPALTPPSNDRISSGCVPSSTIGDALYNVLEKSRSTHTLPVGCSFVTPIVTNHPLPINSTEETSVQDVVIKWFRSVGNNSLRIHGDFTSCDNSLHVSRAWVLRDHYHSNRHPGSDVGSSSPSEGGEDTKATAYDRRLRATHILDWIPPFITRVTAARINDEGGSAEAIRRQQHEITKLVRAVTTTTLSLLHTFIDFIEEVCAVPPSPQQRSPQKCTGRRKPTLVCLGHAVKLLSGLIRTPSALQVYVHVDGEDLSQSDTDALHFWATSPLFHPPPPPPSSHLSGRQHPTPTPLPFITAWLDVNLGSSSSVMQVERLSPKHNEDAIQRLMYVSRSVILPYLLRGGYLPTSSSSKHAMQKNDSYDPKHASNYNWLSDDEFIATMDAVNNGLHVLWGDATSNIIDVDDTTATPSPFLGSILTPSAVAGIVADITYLLFPSSPTYKPIPSIKVVGLCTFVLEVLNGLIFRQSKGIHAHTAIQRLRDSLLATSQQQQCNSVGGGLGSLEEYRTEMDLAYPSQEHPATSHRKICSFALAKLALLQGRCFVAFGSIETIHTNLSVMFAQPVVVSLLSCWGGAVCPEMKSTDFSHTILDIPTQRALLTNLHEPCGVDYSNKHLHLVAPLPRLIRSIVRSSTTSPSGLYAVAMAPMRAIVMEIMTLQQQVLGLFSSAPSSSSYRSTTTRTPHYRKNSSACQGVYPAGPIEGLLHRLMSERWVGSADHASPPPTREPASSPCTSLSQPGPEIASSQLFNNKGVVGGGGQQSSPRSVLHVWGYIGVPIHDNTTPRKSRRDLLDMGIQTVLSSQRSSLYSEQQIRGGGGGEDEGLQGITNDIDVLIPAKEVLITITTSSFGGDGGYGCRFNVSRKLLTQSQDPRTTNNVSPTSSTTTLTLPQGAGEVLREATFKTDIVELIYKAHGSTTTIVDPLLPLGTTTPPAENGAEDSTLFNINELTQVVLNAATVSDTANDDVRGWGRSATSSLLGSLNEGCDDVPVSSNTSHGRTLAGLIVCVEEAHTLLLCGKVTNEQLLANQRRGILHKLRYGSSSQSITATSDVDDFTMLDILSCCDEATSESNTSESSFGESSPRHPLVKSARSQLLHYMLAVSCAAKKVDCPSLNAVITAGPTSYNLLPSSIRGISLSSLISEGALRKRAQCTGALIADHIISRMLKHDLVVGLQNTPSIIDIATPSATATVVICVHPEFHLLGRIMDSKFNHDLRAAVDDLVTSLSAQSISVIVSRGAAAEEDHPLQNNVEVDVAQATAVEALLTIAHGILYCSSSIRSGGILTGTGIREAEEIKPSSSYFGASDTLQILHHFQKVGGIGAYDTTLEVGSETHPLPPLFIPVGSLSSAALLPSDFSNHHHHVRNASLVESEILGRLLSETFIQLPSQLKGGKRDRAVAEEAYHNTDNGRGDGLRGVTLVDLTEDSDYGGGSTRPSCSSFYSTRSSTATARPSGVVNGDSVNNNHAAGLVAVLRVFIKDVLECYYSALSRQKMMSGPINIEANALFALPREHVHLNLDHGSSDLVLVPVSSSTSPSSPYSEVHIVETPPLGTIPWEMMDVCIGNSISRLPHTGYLAKTRLTTTTPKSTTSASSRRGDGVVCKRRGGGILVKADTAQPHSPIPAAPPTINASKGDIVLLWVLNGPTTVDAGNTTPLEVSPPTPSRAPTTSKASSGMRVVFSQGFYSENAPRSKPHTPEHIQHLSLGSNLGDVSSDVVLPSLHPTTTCLYKNLFKDMPDVAVYWYKGHGFGTRLLNANMLSNLIGTKKFSSSIEKVGNYFTEVSSPSSSVGTVVLLVGCSTMRHATSSPRSSLSSSTPNPLINIPSSILSGGVGWGRCRSVQVVLGSLWTIMDRQSDSFSTRIMSHALTTNQTQQRPQHHPVLQEEEEEEKGGLTITLSIGTARLWAVQAVHLAPLVNRRKLSIEARSPYLGAGAFVLYGLPVDIRVEKE